MTSRQLIPKKIIDELLIKSKRRCPLCYLDGDFTLKQGDIHHIKPLTQDSGNNPENLVFLCANHHAQVHRSDYDESIVDKINDAKNKLYLAIAKENSIQHLVGPKVFIISENGDPLREDLAGLLIELGISPISLDEQPYFGMTILEKIERNSDVDYAIVILNAEEGEYKPRQNLILELGYFIGRLGRRRVCVLVSPGIELPSDIHGLLYIQKDKGRKWKRLLTRELQAAGVVANGK